MKEKIPDSHSHDGLWLDSQTEPSDIAYFLVSRLKEPAIVGDCIVFNFSNFDFVADPLRKVLDDADSDVYIIPYQVSGVWSQMVAVLPPQLAHARWLAYRTSDNAYVIHSPIWHLPSGDRGKVHSELCDTYQETMSKIRG